MKKVLLVITLLFTFFLSPIKADDFYSWPYMYILADVVQGQVGTEVNMYIYIDPQYNGFVYYDLNENKIYNKSNEVITGMAELNGSYLFVSCEPDSFEWDAHYGSTINDPVIATAQYATVVRTGNGFEFWYPSSGGDTTVDLSTIQNYMLVICVLLFMNFLRGR